MFYLSIRWYYHQKSPQWVQNSHSIFQANRPKAWLKISKPLLKKIQFLLLFLSFNFHISHAEELLVAVASNFVAPAKELSQEFSKITTHNVRLSFGSTGKLYTQIIHGAPFQVFLAADQERPLRLVSEGFAEKGSQFTYALGRIVLCCPRKRSDQQPVEVKFKFSFQKCYRYSSPLGWRNRYRTDNRCRICKSIYAYSCFYLNNCMC